MGARIIQKITSAYTNKMLRSLEEDKAFWVNKEAAFSTYVAAVNKEPIILEYGSGNEDMFYMIGFGD